MFCEPEAFDAQYAVMFDHEPCDSTCNSKRSDDPGAEHPLVVSVSRRRDAAHQRYDAERDGHHTRPAIDVDEGFTGMRMGGSKVVGRIACVCHASSSVV